MARKKHEKKTAKNGANLGFEQTLWQAADKLRGNMDASDYKHVVLGLIFLKYISDAFEERHAALQSEPCKLLDEATLAIEKGKSTGFGNSEGIGHQCKLRRSERRKESRITERC